MAAAKKDNKDSSAEVKALKAELEEPREALAGALEQIEKLKADGHEYVDLGLSVKWATCNVGASKPEDYGDYFAWGEIKTKKRFRERSVLTYGLSKSELQSQGYIDSVGNLTSQYDAATANWGGDWRMPTKYECQELIDKCKWEWVTVNGVNGYKVTGPNGNKIFLPAAGVGYGSSILDAGSYGRYWSSSPREYSIYNNYSNAYDLGFDSGRHIRPVMGYNGRGSGGSVRPVLTIMVVAKKDTKDSSAEVEVLKVELEETRMALSEALEQIEKLKEKETGKPAAQPKEKTIKDGHEYVDLGLSVKWATCNVGASKPEDYGNYYAWGETSTKTEYTEANSKTVLKSLGDIAGSSYDAARANWGGNWRMPTKAEMKELIYKCTWKWTTQNGVNGHKVKGPSGASIFLPAAGLRYESSRDYAGSFGYYWSSSPYEDFTFYAYYLSFYEFGHNMKNYNCIFGLSVRPVLE